MTTKEMIGQKNYEHIEMTVRRHPVTFLPYIFMFILLLAVPVLLSWLFSTGSLWSFLQNPTVYAAGVLFASIYYLSVILFFYTYFVTFYLDMWIITNDRLLDIEQASLFSRTVAEVDLYQIQDAASEVKGIFPSLFNYGSISLQTAGPVPKFTFHDIPNPDALRQKILDLSSRDKQFHENFQKTK
jgi:hypothetical protein